MGIQYLNRFIIDNTNKSSIRKLHLHELRHKTIVIDTSIYLYKFVAENTLIESLYLLISIFRKYSIVPIFIFDGKPPAEKRELLNQRKINKVEAESKYAEMKTIMESITDANELQKIQHEMDLLKRQFVSITNDDIQSAKTLMEYYGVKYYVATGEADHLIAYLVKSKKAWGCLSDDMDMFVYGCTHVYRHISLLNHTVIYYDTTAILHDLEMTYDEFCEIMVMSGTDYNINNNTSIHESIKIFTQYKKYMKNKKNKNKKMAFHVWVSQNTEYISDYDEFLNHYKIFKLDKFEEPIVNNISLKYEPIQREKLQDFLKNYGFIFCTS